MKDIIIIHSNMEIGGAETSLLGLLNSLDYSKYRVDLFLLNPKGELMKMIPKTVNILKTPKCYENLNLPIKNVFKNGQIFIAVSRIMAKLFAYNFQKGEVNKNIGYTIKEYSHKYAVKFLPKIKKKYDLGISFIDPHYILGEKINAEVKLGWMHTDFNEISIDKNEDLKMWNQCDYIVCVSEACKEAFNKKHPELKEKTIVIENILPSNFVKIQSEKIKVNNEMIKNENEVNLCSVGRFSEAKNFDNIAEIFQYIERYGEKVKWYIIGYGNDEEKIRKSINEKHIEDKVIILGKKENPYPYIKFCDIYVQPSRYEGKAVTVREAQILNKPVIITNFSTAKSQLKDGYDGVIVPIDNEGCAKGIVQLIRDKSKQQELIENTKKNDYSNMKEIEKIYKVMR